MCSYSQCEDMEEEVLRMQVTVMNGIRIKRKINESIPQQGRRLVLRTCQCSFYWQARFNWLRHFQDMLSSEWRKKLTKKAENNSGEDHISSLCIHIKETHLLDPRLPFQKTGLINGVHWSSFHIMALPTRLKTTIWNQYFWAFFASDATGEM